MQALIFGYFFIKEKVKALRWLTEASPSIGQNQAKDINYITGFSSTVEMTILHFINVKT